MKFTKMHGCGNDYIYVNGFCEKIEDEAAAAKKLSDRHFGIGGDGLIIIKPSKRADFEMVMYNPDGTRGAMCGNGIRCVAKYVYDHGLTDKKSLSIESMGAVKNIDLTVENGRVRLARVDMGTPALNPKDIPANFKRESVIGEKITAGGREFDMTLVSMGNPHAVMFIDESPKDFDLNYYGRLFESSAALFPDRVNAEFARVADRRNIEMRVYERGTGETLACGTGACAVAVAAMLKGLADSAVAVHLPGGDLQIEWAGLGSSVFMTGPGETVYTGEIDL